MFLYNERYSSINKDLLVFIFVQKVKTVTGSTQLSCYWKKTALYKRYTSFGKDVTRYLFNEMRKKQNY